MGMVLLFFSIWYGFDYTSINIQIEHYCQHGVVIAVDYMPVYKSSIEKTIVATILLFFRIFMKF